MKKLSSKYMDLVKRVNRIDPDAACYMLLVAPGLKSFHPNRDLGLCFMFDETPQGLKYWLSVFCRT